MVKIFFPDQSIEVRSEFDGASALVVEHKNDVRKYTLQDENDQFAELRQYAEKISVGFGNFGPYWNAELGSKKTGRLIAGEVVVVFDEKDSGGVRRVTELHIGKLKVGKKGLD